MAIETTVLPIGSGFNRNSINSNFVDVQTALANALARDGTAPNQMEADLDMNSNDILNVGSIDTTNLTVDGVQIVFDDAIAKGDQGDPATITVGSVTTGAEGTSVIITNSGTTSDAILNFTIPRGDTGLSGAGSGDMLAAQNLNDVADKPTAFSNIKQNASETATGVVELATDAEAITGTDTARAITPANLTAVLAASGNNVQHFTSSGTWTKPSSGTLALVYLWGAGGSGGRGTTQPRAGGGGGGGSFVFKILPLSSLSSTVAVGIGAGGAAVVSPDTNGIAGGNTTFGAYATAFGGGGGSGSHGSDTAGAGGGGGGVRGAGASTVTSATGGVGGLGITAAAAATTGADGGGGGGGNESVTSAGGHGVNGGGGGGGAGSTSSNSGAGGNSIDGGAGGGGGNDDGTAAAGGTSLNAGNGGAGAIGSNTATSGTAPSGGGGGAGIGTSGAGARGEVWVIVV